MKGKYYCELYDGSRRRSLCLRTDNYELACQRYAAGLKELRKKIRSEHEAAKPRVKLAWLPEEVEAIKDAWKGSPLDAQEIAEQITGQRATNPETGKFLHEPTERLAEQLAGIERITWQDLIDNAERVKTRKTGKGYSPSWHRNLKTLLQFVDFEPQGLTAERIHSWIEERERAGWSGVTLKNRLSALQGLIDRAITSGYKRELAPNVFKQIDFSISKELEAKNKYYCPTLHDYRKLFHEVLPKQPERVAVGIELMAWTGCRISGVRYLSSTERMGWLDIPNTNGTKGGGSCPVPPLLWNRGRDLKISIRALNKVLKEVHPELCNHGLRSGFKMLARMAGTDSQLSESLLMHKLQGLEATYGGDDFPDEAKEAGAKRIWAELEKVLMKKERQESGQLQAGPSGPK